MTRPSSGSTLIAMAVACALFAGFVALTGGIDIRIAGIPLRSRSWERPATLAAVFGGLCLIHFRHFLRRLAARLWRYVPPIAARVWSALPVLAILWALSAGVIFGTFAVGGADSYGYVSQAELFARGRLTDEMPLRGAFNWPDVPWTLTPLGYVPNHSRSALAPSYPPGLPLMMAPLALIHPRAVFLLVPICAAVAVWCCWRLGLEIGEPAAGTLGAVLLSVSPTFLYQSVQPMSDVPAMAGWAVALLLARTPQRWGASSAGVVAGLACLVRPNLAPLSLLVIAAAATVHPQQRLHRVLICAASIVPALVILGVVQYVRYGSPLSSGYESFDRMFSLANISPNLKRYPRWLTETHTPLIWLWMLAPLWIIRADPRVRAFVWICYAFAAAVIAAYLPYVYFRPEEWFYTRFLLPALPLIILLGLVPVFRVTRHLLPRAADAMVTTLCVGLAVLWLWKAKSVGTFELRQAEQKYPEVGAVVHDRLPRSAIVLSMQHSGSIRYYARRPTLRWDVLDRAWLDRALSSLRSAGYDPFVVVDVDEEPLFRQRFASTAQTAIDHLVPIETIGSTAIYGFR